MVRARYERLFARNFRRNAPHPARPAGAGPHRTDRSSPPPGRIDQTAGLFGPAGGARRMAGRLAGPRPAPDRPATRGGVRRPPWPGPARRLGLSTGSHAADGEELPERRGRPPPTARRPPSPPPTLNRP